MYYKAKFMVLGKPPREEIISQTFEEDERINSSYTVIEKTIDISSGDPEELMEEPPEKEKGYEDVIYDGVLDPAWGYIFFETPIEYEPEKVVEIVDEGLDGLKVPVELRYIDANTEAFSDR